MVPTDQCTNEAGSCPLLQYVLRASSYYSLIISIFGFLAVYILTDKIVLELNINGAMSSEVKHCGEGLIYQSIDSQEFLGCRFSKDCKNKSLFCLLRFQNPMLRAIISSNAVIRTDQLTSKKQYVASLNRARWVILFHVFHFSV